MNYLFFLLIPFVLIVPAYAEVGKNFDTENLGNGLTQWTSHYERVFDGTNWQNYILTNNGSQIKFDSAGISFSFNKANCDFKLFDPVTEDLVINSYNFDISVDGIKKSKSICDVVNLIESEDNISFMIDRGDFKTLYELDPKIGMEWTHEIINNEGKNSTFTIQETCKKCTVKSIDGDKFNFGTYTIDIKNTEIDPITKQDIGHHTFKIARTDKSDYILEFEKTIPDKAMLIIDPTAKLTASGVETVSDADNDNVCEDTGAASYGSVGNSFYATTGSTVQSTDCYRSWAEFDLTSIPDSSIVTNSRLNVTWHLFAGGDTYDIYGITSQQPSTRTNAQQFDEVDDNTLYVDNLTPCTPTCNELKDLGGTADTEIQSKLNGGTNWMGIGLRQNSETITSTERYAVAYGLDGSAAQNLKLVIDYTDAKPTAPLNLKANRISGTQIDLLWGTPSFCGSGCTGYKIWRESPIGGGFSVLVSNTTTTATTYSNNGLSINTQYNYKVAAYNHDGLGANSTTAANTTSNQPNAVTTLTATDIRSTAVDLSWTQPDLHGLTLSGYQINYTLPWNINVATIKINNTNSSATAYTFSGLSGGTKYSFRIGVWPVIGLKNMAGNILNITTDPNPTSQFEPGGFNLNQTGTDLRSMFIKRSDVNSTALYANVTYSNTIDLACDLHYKFANTNNTYTIFTNKSVGNGKVESPMLLLDVNNEIIDINCYDEKGSDTTAKFLITQTAFPLLTYIQSFRNGEFGTSGNFGVLDFITLIAIIIGMVGFNRVNPSVGLVFSIFIVGGLAVFGIIQWPTIMTAGIVLIAMFIIGSTRKDD